MDLGSKICELRKKYNLSQEQLAEKINVTRQTISNWELGQTVPDIVQAKQISNIFKITVDELIDNEVKDILVEKISNTEEMANITIKVLKILCVVIIFFLISVISLNITLIIKNKNEDLNIQAKEQEYQNYMDNIKTKTFDININNEKYSYMVQYGEDYVHISDCFCLVSEHNEKADENYEKYINYIWQSYKNKGDERERIKDLKQYFEDNGGTWKETSSIL